MDIQGTPCFAHDIPPPLLLNPLCPFSSSTPLPAMRNLIIYLSALASLSFSSALRHGSSQIRDLVAFPKYEVRFLNDLPLAASDADRCQALGIEREDEFLMQRVSLTDRRRLSDGTDAPSQVKIRGLSELTRRTGWN